MAVLDDDHDEGEETLTLTLTNASGARINDGEATGTIENRDPLPRALLARFGRTAAVHVVEHVEERLQAPRAPGFRGRFAGRELCKGMERKMALGFLNRLGGMAGGHPAGGGVHGPPAGSPGAGIVGRGSLGTPGAGAGGLGAGGTPGLAGGAAPGPMGRPMLAAGPGAPGPGRRQGLPGGLRGRGRLLRMGGSVDVRVRTLLVHQAEGFRERGMALSLSYNPTPSTPLGFTAKLAPSWGVRRTAGPRRCGAVRRWGTWRTAAPRRATASTARSATGCPWGAAS